MSRGLVVVASCAVLCLVACQTKVDLGDTRDAGNGGDAGEASGCQDCLSNADCPSTEACVLVGAGSACLPRCTHDSDCHGIAECEMASSVSTGHESICVGPKDPCEPVSPFDCDDCPAGTVCNLALVRCDPGVSSDGGTAACDGYLPPAATATGCTSCTASSSDCQPNGCYDGWWCDSSTKRCHSPPASCGGTPDGGVVSAPDAGTTVDTSDAGSPTGLYAEPPTGTVGNSGGQVSRLYFAVVGDTRPANADDTANYPTATIQRIYSDVAGLTPLPSFVIATGDFMFATPGKGTAAPQLAKYVTAQEEFAGPVFHAMGNHECTGYTDSNCGTGNKDGVTENFTAFLSAFIKPMGGTLPYYALLFTASDASWTAKIIVTADNAWDATQSTWLASQLAQPTTFTFVVRHEPSDDTTGPGTQASEEIIRAHPLTLELVGHTHTFLFEASAQEVIVGNGGAPLTSGGFGFATISQESATTLTVSQYDYDTSLPVRSWGVDADGTVH